MKYYNSELDDSIKGLGDKVVEYLFEDVRISLNESLVKLAQIARLFRVTLLLLLTFFILLILLIFLTFFLISTRSTISSMIGNYITNRSIYHCQLFL